MTNFFNTSTIKTIIIILVIAALLFIPAGTAFADDAAGAEPSSSGCSSSGSSDGGSSSASAGSSSASSSGAASSSGSSSTSSGSTAGSSSASTAGSSSSGGSTSTSTTSSTGTTGSGSSSGSTGSTGSSGSTDSSSSSGNSTSGLAESSGSGSADGSADSSSTTSTAGSSSGSDAAGDSSSSGSSDTTTSAGSDSAAASSDQESGATGNGSFSDSAETSTADGSGNATGSEDFTVSSGSTSDSGSDNTSADPEAESPVSSADNSSPENPDSDPDISEQDSGKQDDSSATGSSDVETLSNNSTADYADSSQSETENGSGNSYIATIDTSAILVNDISVGAEQDFTISFLEVGSDTIGAADITVPGAFTLGSSSILGLIASEGKNWSSIINGNIIELTADNSNDYLTQGESLSVSFRTEVADADTGAHEFDTEAWQDNNRTAENNMAAGYTNPVVIVGNPVSSEADLAGMAHDGHYILTNNIDLVSDWTPIRGPGTNGDAPFTGSFHGNGYTINDMNIELPNDSNSNIGMFARTEGAWLVDVSLNGFSIFIDDATFESTEKNYNRIGGIVGHAENTSIVNSSISGDIYIGISNNGDVIPELIGGIVGYMEGSAISNSHADVNIVLELYTSDDDVLALNIGGISGLSSNSEIGGSSAAGSIDLQLEGSPDADVLYVYGVGGLAGRQESSSVINMSYSAVEITGSAEGNIGDATFESIGGLVGDNNGSIMNSYALGSLELSGDSTYHGLYAIGGLVGRNRDSGSIENSYAAGTMVFDFSGHHYESAGPTIGGLVGFNQDSGTITNSFYDSVTTEQSDTGKGEPRTTAQMQQASTFRNEQWSITGGSGHYPLLWWQYDPERPQTIWHIGEAAEPGYPLLPPCTCPYSGGPGRYWSPCTTFSSSAYTKTGYDPLKYFKPVAEADKERRALPPTGGTSNRLWAALLWFAAGCAVLSFSKRAALPKLAQLRMNRA